MKNFDRFFKPGSFSAKRWKNLCLSPKLLMILSQFNAIQPKLPKNDNFTFKSLKPHKKHTPHIYPQKTPPNHQNIKQNSNPPGTPTANKQKRAKRR
jgi:hypothetical protein